MKVLHRCCVCCSVSLLVIAGVRGQNALRLARRRAVPSLAMTRVIAQTEPLCREFFPEYDTLRFQAEPIRIFKKSGMRRNIWTVDCLDTQGSSLLRALWDEDQQRLVQIGRSHFAPPYFERGSYTSVPRIGDPQAFRIAREWAVRLHLAKQKEVQSSRRLLRCLYNVMYVKFYLPTRTIRVAMSADSGEVRGASTCDISRHPVPPVEVDTLTAHA